MEETAAITNVRFIRPELEGAHDIDKQFTGYLAQRIAEAREKGIDVQGLVFMLIGEIPVENEKKEVVKESAAVLHYWLDEHKPMLPELTYLHAVLGYEITKRLGDSFA